jgi:glutamate-1-semialdehyde 2,1-aminomutase
MFTLFFTSEKVVDFASAKTCEIPRFDAFFHAMLNQGVYLPPSQFESAFISTAHSEEDIDRTIEAARRALAN